MTFLDAAVFYVMLFPHVPQKLPVSRAVEAALGGGEAGGELLWLDPRAARTDAAARARAAKHPPPTDAVVFVVGGGNYIEYHNLIDFAKVIISEVKFKTWEIGEYMAWILCFLLKHKDRFEKGERKFSGSSVFVVK